MRERNFYRAVAESQDVIAVEPNDDMRAKLIGLQKNLKNLKVLSGTAENTLLENKSSMDTRDGGTSISMGLALGKIRNGMQTCFEKTVKRFWSGTTGTRK